MSLHQPSTITSRSPMVANGHIAANGTPQLQHQALPPHIRADSVGLNGKAGPSAPPGVLPGLAVSAPGVAAQPQQTQPPPAEQSAEDAAYETNVQVMAETWLAIASCSETVGDADKAVGAYDKVLQLVPNSASALTRLGNLYRHRDMFPQAAEFYQRALTTDNTNGETWGLLGHCYLMLDDLQRAYAAYQQALFHLSNPNVPKLWHGIGILYDRYGSLEFAEEAFAKVLALDPEFEKATEIYFRLGIIYKQQQKYTESLDCFKYILYNPPSPLTQPDVWFQIGSVLEQQRDFNGARDAYERVLSSNPRHSKVLQLLGCLFSQQSANFHDLDKALTLLGQSLEIDPEDAHTWYHLGRVYMAKGEYNEAYESFQRAVNKDSRNPTFWCSIGVLYYQISQYRDALNAYTRAIRLNPYISEVWYDLGTLYETCNNQLSDALDAYAHAQRLDPTNPHIKARLEQLTRYQQDGGTSTLPPPSQELRLPQGMLPNFQESEAQQQLPQLRLTETSLQTLPPPPPPPGAGSAAQAKLNGLSSVHSPQPPLPQQQPPQEYAPSQGYYQQQQQQQLSAPNITTATPAGPASGPSAQQYPQQETPNQANSATGYAQESAQIQQHPYQAQGHVQSPYGTQPLQASQGPVATSVESAQQPSASYYQPQTSGHQRLNKPVSQVPSVSSIISSPQHPQQAQHPLQQQPQDQRQQPPSPVAAPVQQRLYPDILNGSANRQQPAEVIKTEQVATSVKAKEPRATPQSTVPAKRELSENGKEKAKRKHVSRSSKSSSHSVSTANSSDEKSNGSAPKTSSTKTNGKSTSNAVGIAKDAAASVVAEAKAESVPANQNTDLKLPEVQPRDREEDEDEEMVDDSKEAKDEVPIRQIDEDEDYDDEEDGADDAKPSTEEKASKKQEKVKPEASRKEKTVAAELKASPEVSSSEAKNNEPVASKANEMNAAISVEHGKSIQKPAEKADAVSTAENKEEQPIDKENAVTEQPAAVNTTSPIATDGKEESNKEEQSKNSLTEDSTAKQGSQQPKDQNASGSTSDVEKKIEDSESKEEKFGDELVKTTRSKEEKKPEEKAELKQDKKAEQKAEGKLEEQPGRKSEEKPEEKQEEKSSKSLDAKAEKEPEQQSDDNKIHEKVENEPEKDVDEKSEESRSDETAPKEDVQMTEEKSEELKDSKKSAPGDVEMKD